MLITKKLSHKKGQAIGKSQAPVLDGKSKQVTAVAKSDFNIIQKIDANNSKHIKVTTNQVQAPVNSSDKVGTATFEDKSLVGEGYLPNQGMPSMELVAGKKLRKASSSRSGGITLSTLSTKNSNYYSRALLGFFFYPNFTERLTLS